MVRRSLELLVGRELFLHSQRTWLSSTVAVMWAMSVDSCHHHLSSYRFPRMLDSFHWLDYCCASSCCCHTSSWWCMTWSHHVYSSLLFAREPSQSLKPSSVSERVSARERKRWSEQEMQYLISDQIKRETFIKDKLIDSPCDFRWLFGDPPHEKRNERSVSTINSNAAVEEQVIRVRVREAWNEI